MLKGRTKDGWISYKDDSKVKLMREDVEKQGGLIIEIMPSW